MSFFYLSCAHVDLLVCSKMQATFKHPLKQGLLTSDVGIIEPSKNILPYLSIIILISWPKCRKDFFRDFGSRHQSQVKNPWSNIHLINICLSYSRIDWLFQFSFNNAIIWPKFINPPPIRIFQQLPLVDQNKPFIYL